MGEGDILNSTTNVPQASSTDRFSNINPDRCMSNPQIDLIGFTDDTMGDRLEARTRTRSRGLLDYTDDRIRNDYSRLKVAVYEWGESICSRAHPVDVIEREHNALWEQIEHKISDVLLKRGDYNLLGELGSLKDRLGAARKEAKRIAQDQLQPDHPQTNRRLIHDKDLDEHHSTEVSMEGCGIEDVFADESIPIDAYSNPREREEPNLSRINRRDRSRNTEAVLACGQEPLRVPSPAVLSHYQKLSVCETLGRRDMDTGQNLTEIQVNLPGLSRNQGMSSLKARQDQYDEQLGKLQDNLVSINITLQNTETSHQELLQEVDSLKCSYTEISQRLDTDGLRLDNFDRIISRVESKVAENLETVQDWFIDLTAQPSAEIPKEIVNSLQDVINDSAPGIAVDRLRDEIQDLRESLSMSQYVTVGLRGLVVDLSEQLSNSSVPQVVLDESLGNRDHSTMEISRRECKIVKKGIQRTEKHLKQLILNNLEMEPADISLIKKYKTVDVPCVHAAVGNIQKSLQRYVKFSEMDSEYCDAINDLLDDAENWCLKVEKLYNKAEIHSINTSKGDTADVGMFSDNAKVTVYEFLEAAEIAYLGWGNSVQKAYRLYNRHLSEEIKSKLINKSDSYAEMKLWLIQNYGGVSRIINDIIDNLSRRTKPNLTNSNARFTFYAHISSALQRIERLSKVEGIDNLELETCLYSRATLSSFSLLLPSEVYADWISEMTRAGMDYKNPEGIGAYTVFKNLCIIERNKSEGSRVPDKVSSPKIKPRSPRSPRTKPKSVHKVADMIENDVEEMHDAGVFATSNHNTKWYPAHLKFPCPLFSHKHEISTCQEFFSFSPVDGWTKVNCVMSVYLQRMYVRTGNVVLRIRFLKP